MVSLLLSLILGLSQAWALPPAVLGPDGPLHVGPLSPELQDPRGSVVVDPFSGRLHLELPGAAGSFQWDGQHWAVDGLPIEGADSRDADGPVPPQRGGTVVAEGARWEWEAGALVALIDSEGGRVRISSDGQGRVRRLEWADGSRVDVRYDAFGRVQRTDGPGGQVLALAWREGGVVATDLRGSPLKIRPVDGVGEAERGIEVVDALGRTSRTWLASDAEGEERIVGWDDPRGLQTRVDHTEQGLILRDGGGRTWRVEEDELGRVAAVDLPGGLRWTWRRSSLGRLLSIEDPAGRIHAWAEDRAGRLEAVGRGSAPWRLRRDDSGRVTQILDPAGAITRLERDPAGRVKRVVDALGNTTALERRPSGQVVRIDGRAGGVWRIERDVLGRPTRVADAANGRVDLERDGGGKLVVLRDPIMGSFRLDRSLDGRLSRLRAPTGEALELRRDGLGRVQALRRADGSELLLSYDALGDVVRLRQDSDTVVVERDLAGAVQRVGANAWPRDGNGRIVGLEAPGRSLRFVLDGGGAIRRISAGEWLVQLARDGAGRVVRWAGSDGRVELLRGPAGWIQRETVDPRPVLDPQGEAPRDADGGSADEDLSDDALLDRWGEGRKVEPVVEARSDPQGHLGTWADELGLPRTPQAGSELLQARQGHQLRASWDPAGRLLGLKLADARWRLLRDAAGRLLRLVAEDLGAVGMDRDSAGRVSLVRYLRGPLVQRAWEGADALLSLVGRSGRELDAWGRTHDSLGRLEADERASTGKRTWRRDPAGRLVVVETDDGRAWSWSPERRTAPDGSELLLDEAGRPAQARPPVGPPAWGVGAVSVSYAWGPTGSLEWVAGELGAVQLLHDGLGRLAGLRPEGQEGWDLYYDARGRLGWIERGDRVVQDLAWGPSDGSERAPLLASGPLGQAQWLWSDWGPAAVHSEWGTTEIIQGPEGTPWWFQAEESPATLATADLLGFPLVTRGDPSADLPAARGSLQPFAGGPLLARSPAEGGAVPAGIALDPISGQRVDGVQSWPWELPELLGPGATDPLDPAPWAPGSPWGDPLALLVALGELEPAIQGSFLALGQPEPVLAGLPAGLDPVEPPLGPPLDALPLDEDPLTMAVIAASLPGATPLDADAPTRVLLAEELALPWLPPGLELPLPDRWIKDL